MKSGLFVVECLLTTPVLAECRGDKASAAAEGNDTWSEPILGELPMAKLWSRDCFIWARDVNATHGQWEGTLIHLYTVYLLSPNYFHLISVYAQVK